MGSGYWLQRNVSCCLPPEGRQYPLRKSWGDIWQFSRWALNEDRSGFWGPNHSCGKNVRLKIELLLVFPGATPLGKLIKPFCAYVVPCMKWELYLLICKHISYLHTFAQLQFFQSVLFLLSLTTNIFLILEPESVVPLWIFHQSPKRRSFFFLSSLQCFLYAFAIALIWVSLYLWLAGGISTSSTRLSSPPGQYRGFDHPYFFFSPQQNLIIHST